jgi:hypothetical protein
MGSPDRRVHPDPDRSPQGGHGGRGDPDLPGASETASLARPYDVIARADAHNPGEPAKSVTPASQALDGVTLTISCPVVHLRETRRRGRTESADLRPSATANPSPTGST